MAAKKKAVKQTIINISKLLLSILIVGITSPLLPVFVPKLADYYQIKLLVGFRISLIFIGFFASYQICVNLLGAPKLNELFIVTEHFTNFRDGIVISVSYVLFFIVACLPFDLQLPFCLSFIISVPVAVLTSVSFSYLFGTDELKGKISNFLKGLKKTRTRKSKSGGTHVRTTDS